MDKQTRLDVLFMDIAERISQMSHARRLKVGAVLVKNDNIISMGWNGTPMGMDNSCEIENDDGSLTTKLEVLHAESNALMKLAASGGKGAEGATLYTKYSPCPECSKLIKQSKISRVVYRHAYRLSEGIEMLRKLGVEVHQLAAEEAPREAPVPDLSSPGRFPFPPQKHEWKDISHGSGGHNGEYDHVCTKCGKRDWIAGYGKVEDLEEGPCPGKK